MAEQIEHRNVEQKYKIIIERAASSTKQIDGFKVEANGDKMVDVAHDIEQLYGEIQRIISPKTIGV